MARLMTNAPVSRGRPQCKKILDDPTQLISNDERDTYRAYRRRDRRPPTLRDVGTAVDSSVAGNTLALE
jgi:hypothetical protein